jgi:hypothetical protein
MGFYLVASSLSINFELQHCSAMLGLFPDHTKTHITNMKTMHLLVTGAALVAAAGFVTFAADKPVPKERVLRIQTNSGQVIAEVHLLAPCKLLCDASKSKLSVRQGDGTYHATGNALEGTLLFHDGAEVVNVSGNIELAGNLVDLGVNTK